MAHPVPDITACQRSCISRRLDEHVAAALGMVPRACPSAVGDQCLARVRNKFRQISSCRAPNGDQKEIQPPIRTSDSGGSQERGRGPDFIHRNDRNP
jgi:hypothetical protein